MNRPSTNNPPQKPQQPQRIAPDSTPGMGTAAPSVAHIEKIKQFQALRRSPWRRLLLKTYIRFIQIRGEPREIALGFALGLFVAASPTMGIQMAIAIFLAMLFKWSKLAAAIGVWITNPVTAPFIYGLTYLIGARILGLNGTLRGLSTEFHLSTLMEAVKKAPEILAAMTIGGILIGIPLAVVGYYVAYAAVVQYRHRLKTKIERQKERVRLKKEVLKEKVHEKAERIRQKRERLKKQRGRRSKRRGKERR